MQSSPYFQETICKAVEVGRGCPLCQYHVPDKNGNSSRAVTCQQHVEYVLSGGPPSQAGAACAPAPVRLSSQPTHAHIKLCIQSGKCMSINTRHRRTAQCATLAAHKKTTYCSVCLHLPGLQCPQLDKVTVCKQAGCGSHCSFCLSLCMSECFLSGKCVGVLQTAKTT